MQTSAVRRAYVVAILTVVLAFGLLVVAAQLLPGPSAPVPTAAPTPTLVAASATASTSIPSATPRSRLGLPDPNRTPGAVNPAVTEGTLGETICKSGWAASVRPPSAYTSALKLVQIVQYGYADKNPSHYEEDHLVPLEVGGAPRDAKNLWPEPNTVRLPDGTAVGSAQKDGLENYLHGQVCTGQMALADAQRAFASDWIAAWEAVGRP